MNVNIMINSKTTKITISLFIFFLLFPPLSSGRQKEADNSTLLPHSLSNEGKTVEKYGTDFFITSDSGDDWNSFTLGYSVYLFGLSQYRENIFEDITQSIVKEVSLNNMHDFYASNTKNSEKAVSPDKNSGSFKPVSTVSYLIKITNYINFHFGVKNGKKTVKVSKSKLTEGLYNIRIDNTGFERSLYYYKLEDDKGTHTGKMFI